MPMKDVFDPTDPLPQFLVEQAEKEAGNAPEAAVSAPRAFKAGVLIAAATVGFIAVLALGNPMALFAEGSAPLVGNSLPQPAEPIQAAADAPPSVPSVADAQAPTTKDGPRGNDIAASEPAGNDRTENPEPASETLFAQFQAWAAQQDAQARSEPVQPAEDAQARSEPVQPVEDTQARSEPVQPIEAPAQVEQTAPAPAEENVRSRHRSVQKHRHGRAIRDARAEMRAQNHRTQVRRARGARAERPTVDARAQEQSAQNAQGPSFLPMFDLHN
jgi:hypothetical protein